MSLKTKPFNHPKLGGNVVIHEKYPKQPQKKPNSTMTGEELLNKAVYGTPNPVKKHWSHK